MLNSCQGSLKTTGVNTRNVVVYRNDYGKSEIQIQRLYLKITCLSGSEQEVAVVVNLKQKYNRKNMLKASGEDEALNSSIPIKLSQLASKYCVHH